MFRIPILPLKKLRLSLAGKLSDAARTLTKVSPSPDPQF